MNAIIWLLLICCSSLRLITGYKHVVLVHGLLSKASHLEKLEMMIKDAHPGTNVTKIRLYPELEAFAPLSIQLKHYQIKINAIMEQEKNGIHLICHSQGGLICQGILEYSDNHNVHTLITLGSPLFGQFGVTDFITYYLPWLAGKREKLTRYMYTRFAQATLSISNYWKDPRLEYQKQYVKWVHFLPGLDNNPNATNANVTEIQQRKKNFLRVKRVVLVGGKDDGVITPWQSSLFGYYDANYTIYPMEKQQMYIEDWFGLRTLKERGGVMRFAFDGVKHVQWHSNKTVFKTAIEKWLV